MNKLGTLPYMSPEIFRYEEAGFQGDIWALGCIMHELATTKCTFWIDNKDSEKDVERRVKYF